MWIVKLIKQDWLIVLQQEFQLKTTFKSFTTIVLEYKVGLTEGSNLHALLCVSW